ncbi:MAG: putative transposase [Candidatus Dormibacteria bacterium]
MAGIQEDEEGGVVFAYGWATGCWVTGEDAGRRLMALQLARLGLATRREVAAGFGTDPTTLWRWDKAYQEEGLAGLLRERTGPKGPSKLTPERAQEIRDLHGQGLSQYQIAERVRLSRATVRRVLGQLPAVPAPAKRQPQPELPVIPPPEPRQEERELARTGALEEAPPVFTQGRELPLLGLLLTLPSLAEAGLLEAAQTVYGKLNNGFYGLRSVLLMLVFLAFLREPRAEGATRIVPQDLGRVLALDRAPEVKTIRRRLRELAARGLGSEFVKALAQHHAKARSAAMGILYVDGHTRVYSGKRRLSKTHITRLRTAGPATEENWVCDGDGEPVLVVMQEPGRSLVKELKALLPDMRELVGDRQVTICFDRGGWSPELFWELYQANFHFLTYRKGRTRKEPAGSFVSVGHREARKEYELTDRRVRLKLPRAKGRPKTFLVRQVTIRKDDHQIQILTSRFDLEAVEVAYRMFSRWRQENYFRYGRSHFALDALDSYQVHDDDLERSVPNPAKAQLRRKLRRARQQLTEVEAAYGQAAVGNPEARRPTMRGFKIANADLGQQLLAAREAVQGLEAELAATPSRLPLKEVAPGTQLLDAESKLVTHGVRMSAYNAESALARLLAPHYRRAQDEGRALLREALKTSGTLEVVGDCLDVRLNHLSAPRRTRALAALCDQLSQTETRYPGTDLVLRYSVNQPPEVA